MSLSASKVEIAAICPASMVLPQTVEVHVGQADGNDRHADLEADIVVGWTPDVLEKRWPGYTWRSEVAFVLDLADGSARELGANLHRAYGDLGPFEIPGTADLVGRGPAGELVVVDRKSFDPGVSRASQNGQLHTLALMACRAYDVQSCEVAIWHELRPLDVSTVEPWDLVEYAADLKALLESTVRARAEFRKSGYVAATPGKHCRWCSAFHSCPAQNALVKRVESGVIGTSVESMLPLESDEDAARAYELLGGVKMLAKRLEGAIRARAAQRPIPLGNGRVYGERPVQGQRRIDGDKAYDLIREKYGQKVADAAVTREATQKGIEDAFKAAGVPSAGAEKDRLVKALEKLGAVTRKDSTKIEEYEVQPQLKAVQ